MIENERLLHIQLNKQASFVLLTESQRRCMCWHVVFAFSFRWRKEPEAPLHATLGLLWVTPGQVPRNPELLPTWGQPTSRCLPLLWTLKECVSVSLACWGCWGLVWLPLHGPAWSSAPPWLCGPVRTSVLPFFLLFCLVRTAFDAHRIAKINRLSLWLQHQLKPALAGGAGPEGLPSLPQTSAARSHPGCPLSCGRASPSRSRPAWVGEWLGLKPSTELLTHPFIYLLQFLLGKPFPSPVHSAVAREPVWAPRGCFDLRAFSGALMPLLRWSPLQRILRCLHKNPWKRKPLSSLQQVKRGGAHAADLRAGACAGVEGSVRWQDLPWCVHRRIWAAASSCGAGRWVHVVETELCQSKRWGLWYHHWKRFSESPFATVGITADAKEAAPSSLQSSSSWGAWAPSHQGGSGCPQWVLPKRNSNGDPQDPSLHVTAGSGLNRWESQRCMKRVWRGAGERVEGCSCVTLWIDTMD